MDLSREQSPGDAREEKAHGYEHEELTIDEQQIQRQQQDLKQLDQQQAQHEQAQQEQTLLPAPSQFVVEEETPGVASTSAFAPDISYEADDDDTDLPIVVTGEQQKHELVFYKATTMPVRFSEMALGSQRQRQAERQHIYELFQPWALKNYGDQAKTKTITMRKKTRILKALEGKEHSRPDSSKFRFWVKTKAFTTKRPADFEEAAGGHRQLEPLPANAVLSDNPSLVDLFVGSTTKEYGKRTYRKVAVVEEFFDIIYNVHMELGGRSGMHAGQKRTYRIITETYAFLPREAVTRFLSICPECKKNLRAASPATSLHQPDECGNESSSEVEGILNYATHTESSAEVDGPIRISSAAAGYVKATVSCTSTLTMVPVKRRYSQLEEAIDNQTKLIPASQSLARTLLTAAPRQRDALLPTKQPRSSSTDAAVATTTTSTIIDLMSDISSPLPSPLSSPKITQPKIRINPQLQRPLTPPPIVVSAAMSTPATAPSSLVVREPVTHAPPSYFGYHPLCFDMNFLKTHDSFIRYYEMMRRFYAGTFPMSTTAMPAEFGVAEMLATQRTLTSAGGGSSLLTASGVDVAATEYAKERAATSCTTRERAVNLESPNASKREMTADEPLLKKFKTSPESENSYRLHIGDTEPIPERAAPSSSSKITVDTATAAVAADLVEVACAASTLPPLTPPPPIAQLSAINLSKSSICRSTRTTTTNGSSSSITPRTKSMPTLTPLIIPTTPLTTLSSSMLSQLVTSTPTQPQSSLRSSAAAALSFKSNVEEKASTSSKSSTAGVGANHGVAATASAATSRSSSSRLPPLDLESLKPITSTYLQLTRSMGLSDEDALRFDNLVSNDFNYTL
ncbi:uncharacterized protein [Eurosta solidaginis]|uniref:uncharacterized protein n=1 Tax=Eurosta solidaginis TaxID=178769 RepID=UPI00353106D0